MGPANATGETTLQTGAALPTGSSSAPSVVSEPCPNPTRAPAHSDLLSRVWVFGIWGAMTAYLFWHVFAFARDIPWMDEWELVPVLSGNESLRPAWLWEQHNEHRIVLPKLVHVVVGALADADLRAVCYLDVLTLSAAAGILIVSARRLRGRTIPADAFIPLVLLHEGQAQNLYACFQVQFILSTVILLTLMNLFVTLRDDSIRWRLLVAAVLTLFLPLCGANGVAVVPALCLFFLWVALFRRASARPDHRYGRPLLLLLVFGAIGVAGLTLFHLAQPAGHASTAPFSFRLRVGFEVLTMLEGPVGVILPYRPFAIGVLLVVVVGLGLLAYSAVVRPGGRVRAAGLLACSAGVATLAFAIGWGRGVR